MLINVGRNMATRSRFLSHSYISYRMLCLSFANGVLAWFSLIKNTGYIRKKLKDARLTLIFE